MDINSQSETGSMTVVGHVEQMHLSRCYQRSNTLTCLTCHSPHSEPKSQDRVDYYRSTCLTCHKLDHCKVSDVRRRMESPENDCIHCHMPRSPTEIPHLAFTHHRIGVPDRQASPGRNAPPELIPFADLSRFSDIDRKRSLGLGYLEAANREHNPARADFARGRALELLSAVQTAGLDDPVSESALARLRFDLRMGDVLAVADAALARPGLIGQDRCNAIFIRADALHAEGRNAEAIVALRELTRLRRHAIDWLMLADCERAVGNEPGWAESLATAARISPRMWNVHQALANYYQGLGNGEKAEWHRRRAVP